MGPLCVLKNQAFKNKAKEFDVSEELLETIVHEYINTLGDASAFPSDDYIRGKITPKFAVLSDPGEYAVVRESYDRVKDLSDTEFNSKESADNMIKDAVDQEFLPEFSYKVVQKNNGKFTIKVAMPKLASGKVEAPTTKKGWDYNEDQKKAIDVISQHISDVRRGKKKAKFIFLEGKAGTGKTSILPEIIKRVEGTRFRLPKIVAGALSYKATMVIGTKLMGPNAPSNAQMDIKSVAALLGLKPGPKKGDDYVRDESKEAPIDSANVLIIDEASMLGEKEWDMLLQATSKKNIPVVFLGDRHQLPPVRAGKYYEGYTDEQKRADGPVITDKDVIRITLSKVVRQGSSSPVLTYADRFVNYLDNIDDADYPVDVDVTSEVTDNGALIVQDSEVNLVEQLIPMFQQAKAEGNPNLVKIVPYTTNDDEEKGTKSAVTYYNEKIRKALYPNAKDEDGFYVGDLVVMNEIFTTPNGEVIHNSLEGAVKEVENEDPANVELGKYITDWEALKELKDKLKPVKRQWVTFTHILANGQKAETRIPVLIKTKENTQAYKTNLGILQRYVNEHGKGSYYTVKKLYQESFAANLGFAYAIGAHKSQGSTYDVVAVDMANINGVGATTQKEKAQAAYTAVTRASNVTIVSTNTTNEHRIFTDIQSINNRLNAVKEGVAEGEFVPEIEEDYSNGEMSAEEARKKVANPKQKVSKKKQKGGYTNEEAFTMDEDDNGSISEGEGFVDDEGGETFTMDDEGNFEDVEETKETKTAKTPQQKVHEAYVAKQHALGSKVEFIEKGHIYKVNGKKADISVTSLREFFITNKIPKNDEEEDFTSYLPAASRIGSSHDAVLRDYFMDDVKKSYPNLSSQQLKDVLQQAKRLERALKNLYGEKAIFITDENLLRVAGTVTYKGQQLTVAGTMDMVVIPEDGSEPVVVDFKTMRSNTHDTMADDKKVGYAFQVSMYKKLLGQNTGLEIGKTYIAQFNVKYEAPNKVKYSAEDKQIKVNGKPIQDTDEYQAGILKKVFGLSFDLSQYDFKTEPIATGKATINEVKNVKKQTSNVEAVSTKGKLKNLNAYSEKSFTIKGKDGKEKTFNSLLQYVRYCQATSIGASYKDDSEKKGKFFGTAKAILRATSAKQANFLFEKLNLTPIEKKQAKANEEKFFKAGLKHAIEADEKLKKLLLSTKDSEIVDEYHPILGKVLMELRGEYGGTGITKAAKQDLEVIDKAEKDEIEEEVQKEEKKNTKEEKPKDYKGVTKVISGAQTGIDTLGLEVAHSLGIETGGTTTPGFVREKNVDSHTRESLEALGVKEISKELQGGKSGKEFYLPRTEQNVLNSDGTVYFASKDDMSGKIATERFATAHNKPFLLNPTAEQLKKWLVENHISTLNVAGNRGSKAKDTDKIADILREALNGKKLTEEEKKQLAEKAQAEKEAKEKASMEKSVAYLAQQNKGKAAEATANKKSLEEFDDDFYSISQKAEPNSSFVSEYTLSLKEQQRIPRVNKEGQVIGETFLDVTERNGSSPKEKALDALLNNSLNYSSGLTISGAINPNMFFTIDHLLKSGVCFIDGYTETVVFDEDDALADFAKAYARENSNFPYNPKTREFRVPKFTVGYSRQEIEKRQKMNKLLNNTVLKVDEIRNLAKASIYKASEFITMIQTNKNGYEHLFKTSDEEWAKDPHKDKDFTQMSRIDIIKEIGIGNILNLVRDRVYSTKYYTQDELLALPRKKKKKMDLIASNWEAFRELGYDTLIGVEEIALDDKDNVKSDNNTIWDDKTEDEIQEMHGSSIEHWQVGFRQVSAFSSLSKLIKRTMDSLYQVDDEGNVIKDEFGLGKHLSAQEAVSKILHYTQGARDINQMIDLLKERSSEEKWLTQIVELLEGNEEKGITPDEQFRTQFYNNFKKYFQKYAITFKEGKGKKATIRMKVINENQYKDSMVDDCQGLENSYATGAFPLRSKDGSLNKENVAKLQEMSEKLFKISTDIKKAGKIKELTDVNELHKLLADIYSMLAIDTPAPEVMNRIFGVKQNIYKLDTKLNALLKGLKEGKMVTSTSEFKAIVGIAAKEMGTEMESVSYEAGKMYYSYVLPSYLGNLIGKLKADNMSAEEHAEFLEKEYGRYQWFKKDGKYRNYWLKQIAKNPSTKEGRRLADEIEHVTSLQYLGTSYADKTPAEYIASMMRMYFYDDNREWAYYRVPMMSNKPSEEYIKFRRLSNGKNVNDYQKFIIDELRDTFGQELDRIQAVRERNGFIEGIDSIREDEKIKSKGKKPTFDKNGLQFKFLDFLPVFSEKSGNKQVFQATLDKDDADYEEAKEFAELLEKKLNDNMSTDGKDLSRLDTLFEKFARRGIGEQFENAKDQWLEEGFISYEQVKNKNGEMTPKLKIFGGAKYTEDDLEEFFWNDMFAAINILQLTVTDTAYYVDTEDLQKRLAQLHAPGTRPDVTATFEGTRYSMPDEDGVCRERTIYLQDNIIESEIIPNLHQAFETMRKKAKDGEEIANLTALEKSIMGAFEGVNVADAQGYSCPTSYRKKMGLFGKWNRRMENAYQAVIHPENLKEGESISDYLDVLWQPLKPFVYTQVGVDGLNQTLPELKVGIQNKNSEYCLILADAIMKSAGNKTNKLSAIYKFMEDSQLGPADKNGVRHPNGKGIDTIQFMSAVNAGCHGVIDLNDNLSEDEIIQKLHDTALNADGSYNLNYVHEIPFEDYMIQQEVPAHFRGHSQAHGSQVRILTFADMMETINGETQYLTVGKNKVTVKQARDDYFQAIADNINDSLKEIEERFNINATDERAKNVALSRVLKDTILKDSRFGSDLLWACDTNEYGEFNIPLSDPTQSNRIQQLLNSIIKNSINKQEIAGGPVVQVTEWGTSDSLHIRFKDKSGLLLLTKDEYENDIFPDGYNEGNYVYKEDGESYEKYIKDQAGVAYFECYVPIQDENIAKDFTKIDEHGNEIIDVKAMEEVNPKFLEMVGYRIPTESKYSMVPIKVKGFLPRTAGEGIMMPAEITSLAGSDFDIDKLYIMRHQLIRDKNGNWHEPEEGTRAYRDNLIISTQMAVLQSEQVQKQLFTPGNFDVPKKYGYLISYVKNEAKATGKTTTEIWNEAMKKEAELGPEGFQDWVKDKNKTSKNLIFTQTQVQFHKQNMTAGKLIGIFAQANVSHAFISLEEGTTLNIPEECEFTVDNINVSNGPTGSRFIIDDNYTIDGKVLISNNLAAHLAASVDAVKDPILNLMNINETTANMVTAMLRMGFPIETVALICSQPAIVDLVKDFAMRNAEGRVSLDTVIKSHLNKYLTIEEDEDGNTKDEELEKMEVKTYTEKLIANLDGHDRITNYMAVKIFSRMQPISDAFGDITHMTRYNSITSAVGPFATDTMKQRIKVEAFRHNDIISGKVKDLCNNNPILKAFRENADSIEMKLLGMNMVQAGETMDTLLKQCATAMGYTKGLPDKLTGPFSDFVMSYFMQCGTKGSLYDLSQEHREQVIKEFPSHFKNFKKMFPDNTFINSIQVVQRRTDEYPVLQMRTRGLSSEAIEDIKQGWAALELSDDPNAQALSQSIVEYLFFRGGFGFSPKTFTNLIPNVVKLRIDGYIEALNNPNTNKLIGNGELRNRLINQFILHHPEYISYKGNDINDYNPDEIDGVITIENKQTKKFPKIETSVGSIIRIGDKFYKVHKMLRDAIDLKEVQHLGGQGQGFEISLTEDFPASMYKQELNKNNRAPSDVGGITNLTGEQAGVLLDEMFSDEELNDFAYKGAITSHIQILNKHLAESNFKIKVHPINEMTFLTLRTALKNMDESQWREFLNKTGKTIKDLNLC